MSLALGQKRTFSQAELSAPQPKRKKSSFESPLPILQLRGRRIYRSLSHWEISIRLDSLYRDILKPQMERSGQTAVKVSRRTYPFLDASYFVTDDGLQLRQYHRSSFIRANGPVAKSDRNKKLVGFGAYKDVYQLGSSTVPMVRGVYRYEFSVPRMEDMSMQAFAKKHRLNPHLAIDHYLIYHSAKNSTTRRCYLMKQMDAPFSEFNKHVSLKTAICMTLQFMHGIKSLAEDNLLIEDLHWGNVLVKGNPSFPGGVQVSISDFDLLIEGDSGRMNDEPNSFFDSFEIYEGDPDVIKALKTTLHASSMTLEEKIACFSRKLKDLETA